MVPELEIYKKFSDENKLPIYYKSWWLDVICGKGNWDFVTVCKGGNTVAVLPYYQKKILGLKIVIQPIFIKTSGIWIKYPENQKNNKKIQYEKKIIFELIEKLKEKKIFYFDQKFHYSFTNWLPFYWKGYQQTTMYNYVIEDLANLDEVYNNFDSNLRKNIRKAQKKVTVKENCDLAIVYKYAKMTYDRQGLVVPFKYETLENIEKKCSAENCSKTFYAVDDEENIHAVLYLVWDNDSAYYLIGGLNDKYKNSQAFSLILWESIKFAAKKVKKYDFEGSMIETVEKIFVQFGATQKQYFNIFKGCKVLRTVKLFFEKHKKISSRIVKYL